MLAEDDTYRDRAHRFSTRVRDISEFLTEQGTTAPRHPLADHDRLPRRVSPGPRPTSAKPTQGPTPRHPRTGTPGDRRRRSVLRLRRHLQRALPRAGPRLGERKAANVLATGAALLVAANPGCLMQVSASITRTGRSIALAHTVEVLDASIRGLPVETLLA